MAYIEATTVSAHNYEIVDLLLEQGNNSIPIFLI